MIYQTVIIDTQVVVDVKRLLTQGVPAGVQVVVCKEVKSVQTITSFTIKHQDLKAWLGPLHCKLQAGVPPHIPLGSIESKLRS
eukprot:3049035-Amphidinium_carterae.2